MPGEGAVLVAVPHKHAEGCQIEFKLWFQDTKPVSRGLTPQSPPTPQGRLAELPLKEMAPEGPGCWLRSGWEGSFNDTQHKTQGGKEKGGGGGEEGWGEKERPPARPVARRRLGSQNQPCSFHSCL